MTDYEPKLAVGIILFLVGLVLLFMARGPQKVVVMGVGLGVLVMGLFFGAWSAYFQVDEGEAYVITRFGRVVRSVTSPGIKFKLPFEKAIGFPSRIQSYKETVSSYSSDGSPATVDFTILLYVDSQQLEAVYKKVAQNYPMMEEKIIIPTIREVARNAISKFTATDLFLNRTKLSERLNEEIPPAFEKRGIIVDGVKLRNIKIREELVSAIQAKLTKQQESEAIIFEKDKAKTQAEIIQIQAEAQALRQRTINSTLTRQMIQYEAIQAMKELAGSSNKTFVIMPTDSKSAGVPLILNSK